MQNAGTAEKGQEFTSAVHQTKPSLRIDSTQQEISLSEAEENSAFVIAVLL